LTLGSCFAIITSIAKYKFQSLSGKITMNAEEIAADLAQHEAVCAERWKTAFNRFDEMDSNIKRIETIIISAAGTIICGAAGIIITMVFMHN
jgi:hypothetical protein